MSVPLDNEFLDRLIKMSDISVSAGTTFFSWCYGSDVQTGCARLDIQTPHRSTSRVSCCFIVSLLFGIIVPILCITLIMTLRQCGKVKYVRHSDPTDTNRTVRLLARSLTSTAHSNGRSFSMLTWSQPIFFKPPCSWSG